MSNIKDVAKLAGVSIATVSRVLNDKCNVSSETIEKVERAIDLLNYKPNTVARSLQQKRSKIIGLIVPNISNPYFAELARAIVELAFSKGYTVTICDTFDDVEREKQYIESLKQNNVAGLLTILNTDNVMHYVKEDTPIVAIDRPIDCDIPCVTTDHYKGSQMATKYMIESGCKEILYVRGAIQSSTADMRYKAFLEMIQEYNLPFYTLQMGNEQIDKEVLEKYINHFHIDGIMAWNDMTAAQVIHGLNQIGLRVPQDIKVIGYDGIKLGEIVTPNLTTIVQPIDELGKRATKLLINIIEKVEGPRKQTVTLPTNLVIREST